MFVDSTVSCRICISDGFGVPVPKYVFLLCIWKVDGGGDAFDASLPISSDLAAFFSFNPGIELRGINAPVPRTSIIRAATKPDRKIAVRQEEAAIAK